MILIVVCVYIWNDILKLGASSKDCIVGQTKWTFKEEKKKKTKLIVLSCTQDLQMSSNQNQQIEKNKETKIPMENKKW